MLDTKRTALNALITENAVDNILHCKPRSALQCISFLSSPIAGYISTGDGSMWIDALLTQDPF